eukprot:6455129-Amphidinium_carterae.1
MERLLPDRLVGTRKCPWAGVFGITDLYLLVLPGLLIPQWAQVRELLDNVLLQTPLLNGAEAPAAELWRRLQLGTQSSHIHDSGILPMESMMWDSALKPSAQRLPRKTAPPRWYRDFSSGRDFVSFLEGRPEVNERVGEVSLRKFLAIEGVSCKHDLQAMQQSCTLQLRRIRDTLSHNAQAVGQKQHVAKSADIQCRVRCVSCGLSGYATHRGVWLKRACDATCTPEALEQAQAALHEEVVKTTALHVTIKALCRAIP